VRFVYIERMIKMITWYYNKFGNIAIWKGEIDNPASRLDSDIYLQVDTDVEAFFEHIGLNINDVSIGDWGVCEDIGYFFD
jgi:hypothetical protein